MNQNQDPYFFPGLTSPPVFDNTTQNLYNYPQAGGGYMHDTSNGVDHGQHQVSGLGYTADYMYNVVDSGFNDGPQAQVGRGEDIGHGLQGDTRSPQFGGQQTPSFFQGGPVQQHTQGYTSPVNIDRAFPRQASIMTGSQYNGHVAPPARALRPFYQGDQANGYTSMNGNNARTVFPRPSLSHLQPTLDRPMPNTVGYHVGNRHVFRQGQQPQPLSSSRYTPYPRRMVQPSTATTFVGARSYGSIAARNPESALHVQGFVGGHVFQHSNAQHAYIPQQQAAMPQIYPNNVGSDLFYEAPIHPRYPPPYVLQHPSPSPAFYPDQQIGYNLGQSQPPLQAFQGRHSPNMAMTAQMPHWNNDNHSAQNGSIENQGAMRQAPSQDQFFSSRAPQMQVYEGHAQFDVSDSSYGGSETPQKLVFNQLTDTGNSASSGHRPVERLQYPIGQTSQSPLVPFAYHEPDVQVSEEDMRTTNVVEDRVVASAGIEKPANPTLTFEEQETITHQRFELHDHNVNVVVVPSASAHSDERDNPDKDGGSQLDQGEVQESSRVLSTASRIPSPSSDVNSKGDSEENGQGVEEDGGEEDDEEDEEEEEEEKMVMYKVATHPGWFTYRFLRPEVNLFVYQGPPGTF